ncbi:tRNA(His) guanylyltransferase Thg1 family protein [Embleya scabrispora]|uniref:tRNA(His) guanylyltransferase Thg1 family protein n=1 Tax=Embleya scabrispora TaxID=159449 RepID=UPI001374FBC5|nr:tRNA(His) guanylyltransferase Thg1 family protein [Embleya scabrispora]
MSDSTALGDRMKRHEQATRTVLPARTYTVIRVDGRSFHTYLRGCTKPFDERFMADMDLVAEALCAEISGTVLAYTQSDEVSVLCTDFQAAGTQPWFGGVVAKQTSIAASVATAALNAARPGKRALFDARVFTLPNPIEVANYLIWRQRDAVRNSISMAAQAHIPHKQLHGVNANRMQEILWSRHGINWNDYPDGAKRGRLTRRHTGEREVTWTHRHTGETHTETALRSRWETAAAPHFTTEAGGFLAEAIPPIPRLNTDQETSPDDRPKENP